MIHLDHGNGFELAMQAFRAGFTSIMIDGSHSVFEENIAITKSVVDVCHSAFVPVEAELGKVGGKEDDLDRLSEIRKVVSKPLVLHGTSGVPDDTVKECIKRGICKVNYATDLRIAFTEGVKAVLAEKPDTIDPKKYNAEGRERVKAYVMSKILVCGSNNKA